MKTKIFLILLTFSAITLYAAKTAIESFIARSDGNSITVEWRCADESAIKMFDLERASKNGAYKVIATQDTKGAGYNYKYIDSDAFFKRGSDEIDGKIQSDNVFTYRLKLHYKNGSFDYTDDVYVTHNLSSIRRTWGMIKEMFR